MLSAGRELKYKQRQAYFSEMTDIAAIPMYVSNYHKELKKYYIEAAFPEIREMQKKSRAHDSTSRDTGNLISGFFNQPVKGQ